MSEFKLPSLKKLVSIGVVTWLIILILVAVVSFLVGVAFISYAGWVLVTFVIDLAKTLSTGLLEYVDEITV